MRVRRHVPLLRVVVAHRADGLDEVGTPHLPAVFAGGDDLEPRRRAGRIGPAAARVQVGAHPHPAVHAVLVRLNECDLTAEFGQPVVDLLGDRHARLRALDPHLGIAPDEEAVLSALGTGGGDLLGDLSGGRAMPRDFAVEPCPPERIECGHDDVERVGVVAPIHPPFSFHPRREFQPVAARRVDRGVPLAEELSGERGPLAMQVGVSFGFREPQEAVDVRVGDVGIVRDLGRDECPLVRVVLLPVVEDGGLADEVGLEEEMAITAGV